ncbi:MAG: hypothetical protein Q8N63_02600 [Nanoarchaeota archaeon]|nr:hypothetical protein [Nanoarchaeota archaeon]
MRFDSSIFRITNPELEEDKNILQIQAIALLILGLTFLGWLLVRIFSPDFFHPSEHWCHTENILGSVIKSWPLFAWGVLMASISCIWLRNLIKAEEVLLTNTATSILAGIWEELGYRCLYIFMAMIGILFVNFVWKFWMVVIVIVTLLITVFAKDTFGKITSGIVALISLGMLVCFWILGVPDPIFWMYQKIVFPLLSFFSIGMLDSILYNNNLSFLFIAGAVSANAKFRDGHKYQGLVGVINSWIIGFVLLYIMIFHGLIVAILCHIIYDLEFAVIRYLFRKVKSNFDSE